MGQVLGSWEPAAQTSLSQAETAAEKGAWSGGSLEAIRGPLFIQKKLFALTRSSIFYSQFICFLLLGLFTLTALGPLNCPQMTHDRCYLQKHGCVVKRMFRLSI